MDISTTLSLEGRGRLVRLNLLPGGSTGRTVQLSRQVTTPLYDGRLDSVGSQTASMPRERMSWSIAPCARRLAQPSFASSTHQSPGNPDDFLPRRTRSQVRLARPAVIIPAKGVIQEVKRLIRQVTQACLRLVHLQLQLGHHPPHHGHGLVGRAARTLPEAQRGCRPGYDRTDTAADGCRLLHSVNRNPVLTPPYGGLSDAELLDRFLSRSAAAEDAALAAEAAFAALAARHDHPIVRLVITRGCTLRPGSPSNGARSRAAFIMHVLLVGCNQPARMVRSLSRTGLGAGGGVRPPDTDSASTAEADRAVTT